MHMTLKEIAEAAGVSISTVSRVINYDDTNAASKEVKERIWDIVRQTGYTPNPIARNLRKNPASGKRVLTQSLNCLIARPPGESSKDTFFSQVIGSIEKEAFKHGYLVKYTFSINDIHNSINILTDNTADGLIILGRFESSLLNQINKYYKNIIYVGLNNLEAKCDQIICNGYLAAQEAMKYLFELGHRNIGYIGDEDKNEDRHRGYSTFLKELSLPYKKENVVNTNISYENGYQGASKLISQAPNLTAILCVNDIVAIGAMRALKDNNLNIPKDISIIGIDDIDSAQFVSPMLTTVHVPIEELGQFATRTLIDRITGGHKLHIKTFLPFYIAKRESCAKRD